MRFIALFRLCAATLPFLCCLTSCGQSSNRDSASADSDQLSVMTWNLEWFYDEYSGDNYSDLAKEMSAPSREAWNWKRDAVADAIAEVKPSVVATQEVENRRVLWYLAGSLRRNHQLSYKEFGIEGGDHFTEQDVGVLVRRPVDVLRFSQRGFPPRLRQDDRYQNVTKQLFVEFEFGDDDYRETVLLVNVHLRARAEAEDLRVRQARLLHRWIAEEVAAGRNVIVLGDFNTELRGNTLPADSDLGVLAGLETPATEDDLVDLTLNIDREKRRTHLLPGRQFDRILCSRSLVEDDPDRKDLVFESIVVRPDLAIRGDRDETEEHWERYWQLPDNRRDLSDHYPVIATFKLK